ncbi:MAG: class I SAM-dependent methyltransferase [Nocardioidaceae bacterium]
MNHNHAEVCSSVEWADHIRDDVLPRALGDDGLGGDVLEIGPGYGAATELVRSMATRLTAVEIDPELAGPLAERYPDVTVLVGSATATTFESGRFDAVVCFTMLHHVPTRALQDEIFAEALRVLRPGGRFAGSDSMDSAGRRAFHHEDTFTPVDPTRLAHRLATAGFVDADVDVHDNGDYFTFSARRPE